MIPLFRRRRRRLQIITGVTAVSYAALWVGLSSCRAWTKQVFGFDIMDLVDAYPMGMQVSVLVVGFLPVLPVVLLSWQVHREKQAFRQGKLPCLNCLYDLRGTTGNTCGECGAPFTIAAIEDYFQHLSHTGMRRQGASGDPMHRARCTTPIISRRRRQLTIFVCAVIGSCVLFYIGVWLCPVWTKQILGVDMFTLTDPDSRLRYVVPVMTFALVLAPEVWFRRWVDRETKAFKQGKLPCLVCLYDVRGSTRNRCRECGTPFTSAEIEEYFQHLSNTGTCGPRARGVPSQREKGKTPIITRRGRQLAIYLSVVMGLFLLVDSLSWSHRGWTARYLGYDILRVVQSDSMSRYSVPAVLLVLGFIPGIWYRVWVHREKKAFQQGKLPCLNCLYDLSGTSGNKCPECGTPFTNVEIEGYFQDL